MFKTEDIKDFYGINNVSLFIYFVFYISALLWFGVIILKHDPYSFAVGLSIGLVSPYLFISITRRYEIESKGRIGLKR